MEQVGDDMLLPQMLGNDGGDVVVGEATIADGAGPNRQIGTVVAASLAPTGAHVATCREVGFFEGVDERRAQRFAVTKRPMTEVNSVFWCVHEGHYTISLCQK